MSENASPVTVDPKEVQEFLGDTPSTKPATGKAPDLSAGVELDIKAEDIGGDKPKAPAGPPPELPKDPTYDANANTEGKQIGDALRASELEFGPDDIKLTDAEKEAFLESVLTDQPAELAIRLPGMPKTTVVIRSRNTFEQSAIYSTLKADETDGRISNFSTWLSRLQFYSLAFQLKRFGNQTFEPLSLTTPSPVPQTSKEPEISGALRAWVDKNLMPLPVLKVQVLIAAVRLFEAKTHAAGTAIVRRDFSQPAG